MSRGIVTTTLLACLISTGYSQADKSATTSVTGCIENRSGELVLIDDEDRNDEDKNEAYLYHLVGLASQLSSHVGDELSITGNIGPVTGENSDERVLKVLSFKTIVKKNPAGAQPSLGNSKHWSNYTNRSYGVLARLPSSFLPQEEKPGNYDSNFVDPSGVQMLQSWSIPEEVYPDSNFIGGSTFSILVNTKIHSEGTCRQFGYAWPGHSHSRELNGIPYAHAMDAGVAMGRATSLHYLHTFQNGFCYEFIFDFRWADGTGLPLLFSCSVQWLSEDGEQKLVNALLAQVSFTVPALKNAARRTDLPPTVTSFEKTVRSSGSIIALSWSTEGADYVQLQYPCVKNLHVSCLDGETCPAGHDETCGAPTNRNFPPNGSVTLSLGNYNSDVTRFVLTLQPFSNGMAYPKGARTITVEVGSSRR